MSNATYTALFRTARKLAHVLGHQLWRKHSGTIARDVKRHRVVTGEDGLGRAAVAMVRLLDRLALSGAVAQVVHELSSEDTLGQCLLHPAEQRRPSLRVSSRCRLAHQAPPRKARTAAVVCVQHVTYEQRVIGHDELAQAHTVGGLRDVPLVLQQQPASPFDYVSDDRRWLARSAQRPVQSSWSRRRAPDR